MERQTNQEQNISGEQNSQSGQKILPNKTEQKFLKVQGLHYEMEFKLKQKDTQQYSQTASQQSSRLLNPFSRETRSLPYAKNLNLPTEVLDDISYKGYNQYQQVSSLKALERSSRFFKKKSAPQDKVLNEQQSDGYQLNKMKIELSKDLKPSDKGKLSNRSKKEINQTMLKTAIKNKYYLKGHGRKLNKDALEQQKKRLLNSQNSARNNGTIKRYKKELPNQPNLARNNGTERSYMKEPLNSQNSVIDLKNNFSIRSHFNQLEEKQVSTLNATQKREEIAIDMIQYEGKSVEYIQKQLELLRQESQHQITKRKQEMRDEEEKNIKKIREMRETREMRDKEEKKMRDEEEKKMREMSYEKMRKLKEASQSILEMRDEQKKKQQELKKQLEIARQRQQQQNQNERLQN